MHITILGTGNGATALAADLSLKGHSITMLKTSNSNIHNAHYTHLLESKGQITIRENGNEQRTYIYKVTDNYEKCITPKTDIVIIFIQSNYHEQVIKKIAPHLNKNQLVLVEPGCLSTPYFLYEGMKDITIAEAESSPIDCRIVKPGIVEVLFRNVRNPIGIYPNIRASTALKALNKLKYNFHLLDSVIEAALHNPNIIVHTVGAIFSIPRIEYTTGEYWMYKEVFTPSIWSIVESLDKEKMELLDRLGLNKVSYVDKCLFRNSNNLSLNAKQVFCNYAQNHSPKGPIISNSRYITEDVSQGLLLVELLGKILNVETPVASSLINLASAALQINFRHHGRKYDPSTLSSFIEDNIYNENNQPR